MRIIENHKVIEISYSVAGTTVSVEGFVVAHESNLMACVRQLKRGGLRGIRAGDAMTALSAIRRQVRAVHSEVNSGKQ